MYSIKIKKLLPIYIAFLIAGLIGNQPLLYTVWLSAGLYILFDYYLFRQARKLELETTKKGEI